MGRLSLHFYLRPLMLKQVSIGAEILVATVSQAHFLCV